MKIDAYQMHFKELNDRVRNAQETEITIANCMGQRYIADASNGKQIRIEGTPGNALGAYLDGSVVEVFGNGQDAVGDTMNSGKIIIHGNVGDACGYAMRGGIIYIKGNAGYRTGIHMKEYKDKKPIIVIGNEAGSFLGEYQAGGMIIVLGLQTEKTFPAGHFCGTGMHGGKIILRCDAVPSDLPKQITVRDVTPQDLEEISPFVEEYCKLFGEEAAVVMAKGFKVLVPDSKNPYHLLYTPD